MKARELATLLLQWPDAEVSITDGFKGYFYHTKGIKVEEWEPGNVDIGIGGCAENEEGV